MDSTPWDTKVPLEATEHQAGRPMEENGHHGSAEEMEEVDNHPVEDLATMEEEDLAEEEDHHLEVQEVEAEEEVPDPYTEHHHHGRVLYTSLI